VEVGKEVEVGGVDRAMEAPNKEINYFGETEG